jgi:cell cycle checkpoint control protein RAD9A
LGLEIFKQPLHTTIAVDTLEFGEFTVEEKLHIGISVKDFKSIIAHAGITNTMVKTLYSRPTSPMQLTYSEDGILTEFILMTIGESRGASATPAPNASRTNSKRPASRQPLEATSSSKRTANSGMPPPPSNAAPSLCREPTRARVSRPSPPPPQPSIRSEALFVPEADDDRRWDPTSYDEEEDEMLLWDTTGDKVRTLNSYEALMLRQIQETVTMNSGRYFQASENQSNNTNAHPGLSAQDGEQSYTIPTQRLAPTQNVSEVRCNP